MVKRFFFIFAFFLFSQKINSANSIKTFLPIYILSVPVFYNLLKIILIEEENSENVFKQKIKNLKQKIEHLKNYYHGIPKEDLCNEITDDLNKISAINFFFLDTVIFDFDSKLFFKKFKVLTLSMILSLFPPIIFLKK